MTCLQDGGGFFLAQGHFREMVIDVGGLKMTFVVKPNGEIRENGTTSTSVHEHKIQEEMLKI